MLIVFLSISTICTAQTTWYVPDDFTTIQGAISDATVVNGDLVIVRQGTYVEIIDFLGKAITVKSEFGSDVTVIDGGSNGSVVTFNSGEGFDSVLEGFKLTNGIGTNHSYIPGKVGKLGGGICCYHQASPTITNTIL